MRALSAEELSQKWEDASWFSPQRDPSNPYDDLNFRLSRALGWLGRAEAKKKPADADAQFIFHWIAFNATYGQLEISST